MILTATVKEIFLPSILFNCIPSVPINSGSRKVAQEDSKVRTSPKINSLNMLNVIWIVP